MKVVGSGAPISLTVRLQPCEFAIWREELRRRLAAVCEPAWTSDSPPHPAACGDRLVGGEEAEQLARLIDQAHTRVAAGQPRVVVGPTWLLAHVIRSVAVLAMDRYLEVGRAFCDGRATSTAQQLRTALDTATACTATLIGLANAEYDPSDR